MACYGRDRVRGAVGLGKAYAGRWATSPSEARTAGLKDWVADSVDEYVSLAIAKAGDLGALSELRAGLRERVLATPLFDAARFGQGLVRALREIAA